MTIKRFLIYFGVFNLILAAIPLVVESLNPGKDLLIPKFWSLFVIFSIVTFVIYVIASWRMRVSSKASAQALLGSITIKLLIYMVTVLFYLSNYTVDPTGFLVNFFYLYFFHTVFEVYCFLCNLRNQNLK